MGENDHAFAFDSTGREKIVAGIQNLAFTVVASTNQQKMSSVISDVSIRTRILRIYFRFRYFTLLLNFLSVERECSSVEDFQHLPRG